MASELLGSVFGIVNAVLKWVEEKADLKEKVDSFVMHLEAITLALNVVKQNPAACKEENIHQLLKVIHHAVKQGALSVEKIAITSKSWFYRPEKYLEELKKQEVQLDRIVPILTLALVPFQQTKNSLAPTDLPGTPVEVKRTRLLPADLIQDAEGLKFWTEGFGEKLSVPLDEFEDEFLIYFELSRIVEDDGRVALRVTMDESRDGQVTAIEFQNAINKFGSLEKLIDDQIRPQSEEQRAKLAQEAKQEQILHMSQEDLSQLQKVDYNIDVLWIIARVQRDDQKLIAEAEKVGKKVLTMPSPGAAIEYLMSPGAQDLLYNRKDFRILTQNLAYDPKFDMVPNGLSAEQIVRFIKSRRSQVPILIYCLKSIKEAEGFAKKYDRVWATCTHKAARSWVQFEELSSIKKLGSLEELKESVVERRLSKSELSPNRDIPEQKDQPTTEQPKASAPPSVPEKAPPVPEPQPKTAVAPSKPAPSPPTSMKFPVEQASAPVAWGNGGVEQASAKPTQKEQSSDGCCTIL